MEAITQGNIIQVRMTREEAQSIINILTVDDSEWTVTEYRTYKILEKLLKVVLTKPHPV